MSFDRLVQSFHDLVFSDPNTCVAEGATVRLGELPDPSLDALAADAEAARALLDEARALQASQSASLGFDQRLDLDLLCLALERRIFDHAYTFNGRTMAQQMPEASDLISDGIFLMFINDPRPAAARLDDITARIQQAPLLLERMLARLDTPVERWVQIEVDKIEALPELLSTVTSWAEAEGYAGLEALRSASAETEAALGRYLEGLKGLPTTTNLHIGEAQTRELVRLLGVGMTLEGLHDMARGFLAETREVIGRLRGELAAKYDLDPDISTADLHAWLNETYAVKIREGQLEDVLVRYQAEREKILAFIRERDLFPVLEAQDMKILRTPGFMEPSIPAGAMMPPPPFRDGVRTSLVYLTLRDDLLDEHTELGIPMMMVHEGIPGHHLQLATAATHPSIVRRHTAANDHAEGWTTMLEDYMLDQGYMGELTDEARFCAKRDISRIGARVAIDLFFMTGDERYLDVGVDVDLSGTDDPFVKASRLLREVTGFVAGRAEAELNWYSQERGYPLSYLTGNTLVWALKRDLQAAQAGRMAPLELDRIFHATYLHSGNMPVTFLRRVFEERGLLAG